MTSSQDYKLTTNDFSSWPTIISMQNIMGPGMPDINDAGVSALMGWVDIMTLNLIRTTHPGGYSNYSNNPVYNIILNTQLKSWIDNLFLSLETFATSYNNRKLPEVYLAHMYPLFVATSTCGDCLDNASQYYQAFVSGADSDQNKRYYGDCLTWHTDPWGRPGKPDTWRAAIDNTFTTWSSNGVPSDLANVSNLFSTASWTNVSSLKSTVLPLWTSQSSALSDLQGQTALDDNNCVFLLYLLCSLATGDTTQQSTVQKIISVTTNSFELPNDTFIDTLIYYVLVLWVDPLGNYGFNSDQIKGNLNALNGVLVNTDAGTQAIKTAIAKYLKILNAVPTYPMTDPYNPNTGFNTRQSDILEAINSVWPCK